jgi:hypothetical protein
MFLKKYWKAGFIPCVLMMVLAFLQGCKSPTEPEVIPIYLSKVEVIYTRNPAKIIDTQPYEEELLPLRYELYDPYYPKTPPYLGNPDFRVGEVYLDKIAENKFKGHLENVLVQGPGVNVKHTVWVWDWRLSDGTHPESSMTGEGVDIERAYDLELLPVAFGGSKLRFKISQN